MAELVEVRTLRQHDGPEGQKWAGDVYKRNNVDADHLVRLGVVEVVGPAKEPDAAKSESAPTNKMEVAVSNKTEAPSKRKPRKASVAL